MTENQAKPRHRKLKYNESQSAEQRLVNSCAPEGKVVPAPLVVGTFVSNPLICHERGRHDGAVTTTNGTNT